MRRLLLLIYVTFAMAVFKAGVAVGQNHVQHNSSRDSILMAIHRQVDLLKLAGGEENINKIDHILQSVADADTTYLPAVLEYAEFLKYHDAQRSIKYYLIYQRGNTAGSIHSYIDGLVLLSDAYHRLRMYDKNEKLINEAIELINNDKARASMSEDYLYASAKLYSQVSMLYSTTNRYDDAETTAEKSLNAYRLLSEIDSVEYMSDYGQALKIAGDNYREMKKFDKAKECLYSAFNKFQYLYAENARTYCAKFGWTAAALGMMYKRMDEAENALPYYDLAIKLYREAVKYDPAAYDYHLATTLNNKASILEDDDSQQKYELFNEAASHLKKLVQKNATSYRGAYLTSQKNLCSVSLSLSKYQETIDLVQSLMSDILIISETSDANKKLYLGRFCIYLAEGYKGLGDNATALGYFNQAIDILQTGTLWEECVKQRDLLVNANH